MGSRTKQKRFFSPAPKKSPVDEARDLLATVILAHVPVSYLIYHCLEGCYIVLFQNMWSLMHCAFCNTLL
jgi:hypothetical protein